MRRAAAALAALLLPLPLFAAEPAPRAAGLPKAWADPQAARTVFFLGGMTCRACTMLLDRRMAGMKGIHWARFNFPVRLLVVYHDPRAMPTDALRDLAVEAGLRAELLESRPAAGYPPGAGSPLAAWEGGALTVAEARRAPERFRETLRKNQLEEGDPETTQVVSEIVGEEVRRRILAARAAAAGYLSGPQGTTLPAVLSREFYYPADALKPTPLEAGIALFLKEKVLLGDEGEKGRGRFDSWLRDLWREVRLDFRPEYLETGATGLAK